MKFDWMESVKELNCVEFKHELSENFLPEELSFSFVAEKNNSKVFLGTRNIRHEQLKIIQKEFRIQQFLLGWGKLTS